jgi:macrodomain Ter protein organizer (MatP/YcbG family)
MSYLTWHGATKAQSSSLAKTRRRTAGRDSTGKSSWDLDDVFKRLIEIADQEAYVKSELIMDWISKARPKQHQVEQVRNQYYAP